MKITQSRSALALFAAFILMSASVGCSDETSHAEEAGAASESAAEDAPAQEYVCPMHPQVRQDGPGTCPICFMDLVPGGSSSDEGDVPSVRLSEGARRLAGVANARVQAGPLDDHLEVFGRLEVSEQAEVDLSAWVGGRIERLYVNARGETVKRGQRIARIYSPELLSAQQTLIQAQRNLEDARSVDSPSRTAAAQASMRAVRDELRLLGMETRQIDAVLAEGVARETVDVFAQASGTVRERQVSVGDYVTTGQSIVSLAALDTVWAQLEIFEQDIPRVSVGQPVEVTIPALNRTLEGRVDFIAPEIEPQRRVMLARVPLPNEGGELRPGMFVEASLERRVGDDDLLSLPFSAVLWTGPRSLVYQLDPALEPPAYVPVQVELGERIGDRVIIEDGLKAGDEVAAQGAFRIDASLQIRGGPSMMSEQNDLEPVEVAPEGTRFEPPIDPARLPDGVWYCEMGTTHYAQHESGECPVCGMFLEEKGAGDDDAGDDAHQGHDHSGGNHAH
ncbi:efflux RND transporter periplasmic adaptor subunit [Lujinxingia vulgaris]|uniref:Efflux RND transporter periplasmic adaptor subunit n=1 Tax=Lujinxingia vulgaris TaxID=2600176 RepID=A0A5C6XKL8_9DELT|nr:efflux RND transporter periplasmic adaptor subunit [Lujinxingia vulgaris]TXD37856.1 efflux RND transporter periplasmic adaptor subunit [Lujinxingia vulgaris]